MGVTSIQWTDRTWSPLRVRVKDDAAEIAKAKGYSSLVQIAEKMAGHVGPHCEHVSEGCKLCYSGTNNHRCLTHNGTGLPFDRRSRDLIDAFVDEVILPQPLKWRKPQRVFVENQSDLFGEWYTDEMIDRVFAVMALSPRHTFQILTKRPIRMVNWMCAAGCSLRRNQVAEAARALHSTVTPYALPSESIFDAGPVARGEAWGIHAWPLPNVWLGVSCEDQETAEERIPLLLQAPAAVRFVSYEPALRPVDFKKWLPSDPYKGKFDSAWLDWGIIGGESGAKARPHRLDHSAEALEQFRAAGVAAFFKQAGAYPVSPRNGLVAYTHFPGKQPTEIVGESSHGPLYRVRLKDRKGGNLDELPNGFNVRQFPGEARR